MVLPKQEQIALIELAINRTEFAVTRIDERIGQLMSKRIDAEQRVADLLDKLNKVKAS